MSEMLFNNSGHDLLHPFTHQRIPNETWYEGPLGFPHEQSLTPTSDVLGDNGENEAVLAAQMKAEAEALKKAKEEAKAKEDAEKLAKAEEAFQEAPPVTTVAEQTVNDPEAAEAAKAKAADDKKKSGK